MIKPVVGSWESWIMPEKKDGGDRKSEQPPNHPQPKPVPVQTAVESAHQESDSAVTYKYTRTDH